ncbi:MAG: hypothetical protein AB1814_10970 [Thermodesulfobacteriota bacterium]
MAEIKSALEIALERAAALGRGDDHEARREGRARGTALARRFLDQDLAAEGLASGLAELEIGQQGAGREGAWEVLLAALDEGRPQALEGLKVLAQGQAAAAAWQELERAEQGRLAALTSLEDELAAELQAELAAAGIAGSAARANPQAHPQYEQRRQAALAQAQQKVAQAAKALSAALGTE